MVLGLLTGARPRKSPETIQNLDYLEKPGFLYKKWPSIEKTWFFVYILKVSNLYPCKNLVFCIYFENLKLTPLKKPGFLYIFWKSQIYTIEKTWFFVYILKVTNWHPWKNLVFCIYFECRKLTPLKKHCFLCTFWKSQIDTLEKTLFFVYILNVANWQPWKNIVFCIYFECRKLTTLKK